MIDNVRSIIRWFAVPVGMSEEEQHTHVFRIVVVMTMTVVTILFTIVGLIQPSIARRAIVAMTLIDGVGIIGISMTLRGRTRLASQLFIGLLVLLVTIMAVSAGGVRSPGIALFMVFTLLSALLLGPREATITAGICAAIAMGLVAAEMWDVLPEQTVEYAPISLLLLNLVYLTVMLVVVQLIVRTISRSLIRAQQALTEQQRVAAEMHQALLERDNADRKRELMETSLRHAQKMDALGTLAGGIAHDFNNILTAIGGNAELGLAQTNDPAIRESFSEIRAGYARARDLVKRIMIFSRRQESAQTVIRIEPVAMEAAQLLKASLPPRIEIRTRFAPNAPAIKGDGSQIHQIVMNLGTNAAHAMRTDAGVMDISIDSVDVEGSEAARLNLEPGPYARLTVSDTGTGMKPEVRERLFEPFFTTKGVEGTGLGLAVVHGIVRDHRGAIDVNSEWGQGTTFSIYLPAVSAEGIVEIEPEVFHGNGERVMYIDDDTRVVNFMSKILKRLGYDAVCFTDPVQAIDAFGRSPFAYSVVITDFAMPVMNGVEVAAAVHAIRPEIPVALASGYGADDRELTRTQNIAALIQKPATIGEISRVVRELVTRTNRS